MPHRSVCHARAQGRAALVAAILALPLAAWISFAAVAQEPPDPCADLNPQALGQFATALCEGREGVLWVGTEDTGVWRYDAKAGPSRGWTQFTRANTRTANATSCLGDDFAYALACDKLGRIWVGHLNRGVSVFNGKEWKNYDVLSGPLGERVFDIKPCPVDGDIWIATNAGLSRYRLDFGEWCYYTRAEGLPAEDVRCLAFDRSGTLYAGTACDGLAIGTPSRAGGQLEYVAWRNVRAPERLSDRPAVRPSGEGLPSDLLNDVLAARDGTVYVATVMGLAASRDKGRTWQFLRGKEWEAKAQGLYRAPSKEQIDAARKLATDRTLLLEDYVTCLAEDDAGNLWIGHRQKGHEVLDPRTGKRLASRDPTGAKKEDANPDGRAPARDYVTRLLARDGEMLAATYGAGLAPAGQVSNRPGVRERASAAPSEENARPKTRPSPAPPLPEPAARPFVTDVRDMLDGSSRPTRNASAGKPLVVPLNDDWRTQGDWIDRYGRSGAVLCAMAGGGMDLSGGEPAPSFRYRASLGPHCRDGDVLRYWVHWIQTDNVRSLQNPGMGGRKQSEWDDHGETYDMSREGPDIFVTFLVPQDATCVSLYFFNKDGHTGNNRWRDYLLELKPTVIAPEQSGWLDKTPSPELAEWFERLPVGVRVRVKDFWGGVYKRFYCAERGFYTVRIRRNHSFNAVVSGLFLDNVAPPPGAGEPDAADRGSAGLFSRHFRGRPRVSGPVAVGVALDDLLQSRQTRPDWYAARGALARLQLLRLLTTEEATMTPLASELVRRYPGLRQDVAKCAEDQRLFDLRDRIHYPARCYASYEWSTLTALGAKWQTWRWDAQGFQDFVTVQRNRETW